ncbi:hypothetical protein XACb0005 (plasmid) [Xanthomonas citri pv. citri str. 306]|uniref:Uncharacterized protein n=1 Tax=Xanthomonas axonopodis pv. citri (strain 306) TaxID=190486 RepID=A0AAI8ETS4_XANAC|nr:hypothetical protein XACb0005 [Xanthomonas citri pv. citri str. 306]CEE58521.1 conserved hypothetical protein [Xanthomonas citri pv. citri]
MCSCAGTHGAGGLAGARQAGQFQLRPVAGQDFGGHRRRAGRLPGRRALGGFALALELGQLFQRGRPPPAVDLGGAHVVGRQHLEHHHAQRQQLGGGGVERGKHAWLATLAGQLLFGLAHAHHDRVAADLADQLHGAQRPGTGEGGDGNGGWHDRPVKLRCLMVNHLNLTCKP